MSPVSPEDIKRAYERIAPYVQRTQCVTSPTPTAPAGTQVFLKLENQQHTGSFKLRGACNMVLTLTAEERHRGIVTASTGNHGAGVSFAAKQAGSSAKVFVPNHANPEKLQQILQNGAEIEYSGDDCVDTEFNARSFARSHDRAYVPPYNHSAIIAGQGTVGLELAEQVPHLDVVFVAVGGGGLISGVAIALKSFNPNIQIVACSPENSCVMHQSLAAGSLLDAPSEPTLSDSTAGGIEPDSMTFPICKALVDRSITVSEPEIAAAMRTLYRDHKQVVEGAAGVAFAGMQRLLPELPGQTIAVVICGGNVPSSVFSEVIGD